ncbi:hypothetical protein C8J56DRAFT_1115843 [Mycena floridula]|nr:hypothetical protein C8J56DRAFT_1115843 [Mycena floridula]
MPPFWRKRTRTTKVHYNEKSKTENLIVGVDESLPSMIQPESESGQVTGMRVKVSQFRSTSRIDGGIASDNTAKSGRSFSVLVEDSQVADVGGGIACGNQFNTEKLVPGPPGEKMSMQAFCKKYDLSDTILDMLMKHGYETARALCYLAVEELEDMGLKTGPSQHYYQGVEHGSGASAPAHGNTSRSTQELLESSEVAQVSSQITDYLQQLTPSRDYPTLSRATRSLRKKSLAAVRESITWADRGVVCAKHHLEDLSLAIRDRESTVDWHLKQLQREAAKGKAHSYKIQSRIPELKALGVVTLWWEELIKVRHEIEQKVESKEDLEQIMQLIDDQSYLGRRFFAYSSQVWVPFVVPDGSNLTPQVDAEYAGSVSACHQAGGYNKFWASSDIKVSKILIPRYLNHPGGVQDKTMVDA